MLKGGKLSNRSYDRVAVVHDSVDRAVTNGRGAVRSGDLALLDLLSFCDQVGVSEPCKASITIEARHKGPAQRLPALVSPLWLNPSVALHPRRRDAMVLQD